MSVPPLRFECTSCGKCCRIRGEYAYVYVNDAEVKALAKLLDVPRKTFRSRYTKVDEGGWRELLFEGDRCIFLDGETNQCTVYEARPFQCRTFPFWTTFVDENGWTDEVRAMCEGIDQGRVYSPEETEELLVEPDPGG